jgi:molecular chaperone DnaJ
MKKDYYEILGVTKGASKDEIKKAFHKMAHKYHPDKNNGNDSKFKEVNEAYQVLSDETKRSQYDQFGSAGPQGGFGGFDPSGFAGGFQGGFDMGDLNDIFSEFFNGGMGGFSQSRARKRGRDISTELSISFSESVFGVRRKILLTKQSTCKTCDGSGAKAGAGTETCKKCNGNGQIHETKRSFLGTFSSAKTCDECNGSGKVPKEKCAKCHGAGVLRNQEEIEINIPAGIQNGEMVRLTQMGEAVAHGQTGDLYIKINVEPHPTFKRDGTNLVMDMNIKLSDALLGAEYTIKTLDGDTKIKIPEGVSPNEILRVKERGVPISKNKRGDLLIKIKIKFPNKLSKKERDLILKLKEEGI